jgi:hypothetical protein
VPPWLLWRALALRLKKTTKRRDVLSAAVSVCVSTSTKVAIVSTKTERLAESGFALPVDGAPNLQLVTRIHHGCKISILSIAGANPWSLENVIVFSPAFS